MGAKLGVLHFHEVSNVLYYQLSEDNHSRINSSYYIKFMYTYIMIEFITYTYHIALNYGPGVYFFPVIFYPGH